MKKKITRILAMVFALTLLLTISGPVSKATEVDTTKYIELPITIELRDKKSNEKISREKKEAYTILLEAVDESAPMPIDSENNQFKMVINGEGAFKLPVIKYTELGVHHYRISQIAGNTERFTYDNIVYDLIIYVTRDLETGDLMTTLVATRKGDAPSEETKLDELIFKNLYEKKEEEKVIPKKPTPKPTKPAPTTGDDNSIYGYIGILLVAVMVYIIIGYRKRNIGHQSE